MGRYDQALKRYLRALELRRQDGDRRDAGDRVVQHRRRSSTIRDATARRRKSKEEALKAFRELKQRDFWFGEILSGHGYSLALSGRLENAEKSLEEALAVARELKNTGLIAQILADPVGTIAVPR